MGLAALFAAPVMPAAATTPATLAQHFARAELLARCHGGTSAATLGRLMKLDSSTAQKVFEMLGNKGVISTGIDGVARAINPLDTHCIPTEAIRHRSLAAKIENASKSVQRIRDQLQSNAPTTDAPPCRAADDTTDSATEENTSGDTTGRPIDHETAG